MKPEVIIIGRPNVGKSTLFNRLVGKKLALVDDQPGVTRDRRMGDAEVAGMTFTVVDTAGWEDEDPDTLPGRMRMQTEVSIEGADAAMFVIDARAGLTPLDEEIARWLREQEVPVVLVANKAEGKAGEAGVYESYSLGLGEPVPLSAEHGEGIADLFGALWPIIGTKSEAAEAAAKFAASEGEETPLGPLKLAIVGRPNAGKSTLINRLLGEDRLLTGPEAGITRDSIAIDWKWTDPKAGPDDPGEREIRLIDTAGMRKKRNVTEKLEKLSVADARRAVDFAEVVVLLLDANSRPGAPGSEDRGHGAARRPRFDDRDQQVGYRGEPFVPVQRYSRSAGRWLGAGTRLAAVCSQRENRQGLGRHATRGVRDPRKLVQTCTHRCA